MAKKKRGRKPKVVRKLSDREIATLRTISAQVNQLQAAFQGTLAGIMAGAPEGAFLDLERNRILDRAPEQREQTTPRPTAEETPHEPEVEDEPEAPEGDESDATP